MLVEGGPKGVGIVVPHERFYLKRFFKRSMRPDLSRFAEKSRVGAIPSLDCVVPRTVRFLRQAGCLYGQFWSAPRHGWLSSLRHFALGAF